MPVYDLYGRPIAPPKRADLLEELAAPSMGSVRQIITGHAADGLDPKRLSSILRAAELGDPTRYLELAEGMEEKDLHYASVLGVRKRGIRALETKVEPGGESAADEEAAELVRGALASAAIKDDLIDMLDAIGKGYSVTEILWSTEGRQWTVAALEWREPQFFVFDTITGRQLLLRSNEGDVPLRPYKFIRHFARAKSGLPIRGGLARLAAWAFMFKTFTIKDWAIFAEAYGHPLRLGKYGPEASAEDRQTLLRAVRQIGVDMAAIVPQSMEIDIVEAAKVGADKLYESAARYWDEQLSKGVLGQTGTTDAIAGGYAVGRVHDEVRDDIRDADAEQLGATLTRDLAAPLTALNFGTRAACPLIRFERPEVTDPKLMLDALRTLVPMGLRVRTADIRRAYGLPEPEEGEEVLEPPAAPDPLPAAEADMPPEAETPDDAPGLEAAAARREVAGSLDDLVARMIDEGHAAPATDGTLTPIVEALGDAETIEDVRDVLARFADEAPDETLRDLIARLTFTARLAGETGLRTEDRGA